MPVVVWNSPVSEISDPQDNDLITTTDYTVTGTAEDHAGAGLSVVEVSTDGGQNWHNATGTTTWSYSWTDIPRGEYDILSRATDNMSHVETPGSGVSVTVDRLPVHVSANASAGFTGVPQQVTCAWSDADGVTDLDTVYVQLGSIGSGGRTKVKYNNQTNLLYLLNDAETAWVGGYAPNSANTISNSSVLLDCLLTAISTDGNTLTGSFNVKPLAGFTGNKPLNLYALDMYQNHQSGWETKGYWLISLDSVAPTTTISYPSDDGCVSLLNHSITGSASDGSGSGVDLVEVTTDGGSTWNDATGTTSWSYDWPLPYKDDGIVPYSLKTRATDLAGNVETVGDGITAYIDNMGPVAASWLAQLGTTSIDKAYDVCADSSGNIYVVGITLKGLDGNTNLSDPSQIYDAVLIKYDATGTKQWTEQFGTTSADYATGVSVDSSDYIYVTGYTGGTFSGCSSSGGDDSFISKFDSNGNNQWNVQFGTSSNDYAEDVSVDSSGVYSVGYTDGSLSGTNAGEFDLFVVKYELDGDSAWARQRGTSVDDFAYGVSADSNGYVYAAGQTYGGLDGYTNAGTNGSTDIIIVKYDSSGTHEWTYQYGNQYGNNTFDVCSDADHVYVAGTTAGNLEGNTSAGAWDMYVSKCDASDHSLVWTKQLGTSENDYAYGVCLGQDGEVFVAGYNKGNLDGNIALGEWDMFVSKYGSDGDKLWTRQFGTSAQDYGMDVESDGMKSVFVAGYTYGSLEGFSLEGNADIAVVGLSELGLLIDDGADTTNSTSVTLTLSADDHSGVDEMVISNDGVFDAESWQAYSASWNWTLATGDGEKTVYVKFRDIYDNVSDVFSDTITLDTQ